MYPKDFLYSKHHVWVDQTGEIATIGITSYASDELEDISKIELPEEGDSIEIGDPIIADALDFYSPVAGEVVEVNPVALFNTELIVEDPHGEGWLLQIKVTETDEGLMNQEQYLSKVGAEE
jgi:glycine cleavage system H protein